MSSSLWGRGEGSFALERLRTSSLERYVAARLGCLIAGLERIVTRSRLTYQSRLSVSASRRLASCSIFGDGEDATVGDIRISPAVYVVLCKGTMWRMGTQRHSVVAVLRPRREERITGSCLLIRFVATSPDLPVFGQSCESCRSHSCCRDNLYWGDNQCVSVASTSRAMVLSVKLEGSASMSRSLHIEGWFGASRSRAPTLCRGE